MVPSISIYTPLLCTLLLIASYRAVRSPKGSHVLPTATNETASGRGARIFSIFSIVQFPNTGCTTSSGTYSNGTCFTASECAGKGGTSYGTCAAGFGVCCVFTVSATGTTITENCTYIVNPGYPSNYVPTSTPATLTYTIGKCQDDICRIRLDFETFILTQPTTVQATEGQCLVERLELTTTSQTLLTAAAGTYGSYPYLCGTNTGLHAYLDLSPTSTDTGTLDFTFVDSTTNQFKIKVTMLSCSDYNVAQQAQCFQYFTGPTGTFSSYNYDGAQMIAFTQYNACIRQEADHCCIQWSTLTATSFRAAGGRPDAAAGTPCVGTAIATLCSSSVACSLDFVQIQNAGSGMGLGLGGGAAPIDRYCGPAFSPYNAISPAPVISCDVPFRIGHQTAGIAVGGAAGQNAIGTQFRLTYSQIPGTC